MKFPLRAGIGMISQNRLPRRFGTRRKTRSNQRDQSSG